MIRWALLLWLVVLPFLAGCGGTDDRQWMKVNGSYTTQEFRRDYSECTRSGKLDDPCMRGKGWVSVSAPKESRGTPEKSKKVY